MFVFFDCESEQITDVVRGVKHIGIDTAPADHLFLRYERLASLASPLLTQAQDDADVALLKI
jgi:hypothetical protein